MNLFYFGDSSRRLFGASETARVDSAQPKAVVLCYPWGQEQLRAHRAFRNLSVRLAKAGWHVLRFDYYGCGDSAGESGDGDFEQWLVDTATAVEQAKRIFSLNSVSLIGLRLGATLATVTGSQRNDIDQIAAWDPVLSGSDYIQEQLDSHNGWLASRAEQRWEPSKADNAIPQVLGFPLTEGIRKSLGCLDLLDATKSSPAKQLLIVQAEQHPDACPLQAHLRDLGCDVESQYFPEAKIWHRLTMSQQVVPNQTLAGIVTWLTE